MVRCSLWMCACLVLAAALFVPRIAWSHQSDQAPKWQPSNIVLILADDLRWDALGAAPNSPVQTPALNQLAANSVWFRQYTTAVPQSAPARATLLTGLLPHQHRWHSNQYQLPELQKADGFNELPMLPVLLQKQGYRTVLIGKWHLRPEPKECGFAEVRHWLPGGSAAYRNPRLADGQARDPRELRATVGYSQQIFADDAIAFLRSAEAENGRFLLWVAFTAPHPPHYPNPEHIERLYENHWPPPRSASLGAQELLGKSRHYCEAVSFLDEQVGRILAVLDERKLAARTLVAFCGDNGFMLGEHGSVGNVLPYEATIRTPLIIRAPGSVAVGGVNDAPVSSLDLPPTLLRVAAIEPPLSFPGRDLLPLLAANKSTGFADAICEWSDNQSHQYGDVAYRLIRTPEYKLILWERANKPAELYDLRADPLEGKNLIDDAALTPVRTDLRRRLQSWLEKTNDPALRWGK